MQPPTDPPTDKAALRATVLHWRARKRERPPSDRIVVPGPGQESVWAYPRPPRVSGERRRVRIVLASRTVADTGTAKRVVETSGAPVYYIPLSDIADGLLVPTEHWSLCEWKGIARYFDVVAGSRWVARAAWHYPEPLDDLGQGYEALRSHAAFYPAAMDACFVGAEKASAQPGGYYGGWVTSDVVGPFKGEDGSADW